MIVSLLVAMDERRGIGKDGNLPWRLSSDLKKFRELTMNHHIIVGRKTYESIGKPLPGRHMIIISRNRDLEVEGCFVVHSLEEAIEFARGRGETEVFICGGAEIYAKSLDLADRIYLTRVHAEVEADTFFPEWNGDDWVKVESIHHPADDKNQYPFTFEIFNTKIMKFN